MKSPVYLINRRYNGLRKSEKRVAEFVQKHLDEVILLSLQGLADKCDTSDATVLRFCRSLGYQSFSDFKTALIPELLRSGQSVAMEITSEDDPASIKDAFLRNINLQNEATIKNIEFKVIQSVTKKILDASRTVILGMGGSAGVAHILSDSLVGLGIYAVYLHDRSIIQNIIPILNASDVVIGISHAGETEEVVSGIKIAREYGAVTVGLTNFSPSPLADVSEYVLLTSTPNNLLGSFSCQSRISQLAILELLLIELKRDLAGEVNKEYNFENEYNLSDVTT